LSKDNPLGQKIPEKFQEAFKTLDGMFAQGVANAQSFTMLAENDIYPITKNKLSERQPFEDEIRRIYENQLSLTEEKQAWLRYISFEVKERGEL
jgi:hypothetical protein